MTVAILNSLLLFKWEYFQFWNRKWEEKAIIILSLLNILVVDNLEPTEIIVSFSSLSRWFDPPADLPKTSHSSTRGKDQLKDTESIAGSSSVADGKWS